MLRFKDTEEEQQKDIKQSNGQVQPQEGARTLLRVMGIPPPSDLPGIGRFHQPA